MLEFELNPAGVRELLQSPEIMSVLVSEAESRASGLGEGYEITTYVGKTRCNASIHAVSKEAMQDALDSNTLLQVIS